VPETPIALRADGATPAGQFTIGVRPEDLVLGGDGPFQGKVTLVEPLGVETLIHFTIGAQTLISTVPGLASVRRGEQLRFGLNRERLHVFDAAGVRV
jgi:multiple sugar transport system ATP-binding protein